MQEDKTRFDVAELQGADPYKLLTGLVVPRPIGWIGSVSADGVHNLAPYSFFNAVSGNPPMVVFSAGYGDGVRKDTADNVKSTREFTVNIVTDTTVEAMNASSASLPASVDEFEHAGLTPLDSAFIAPKRVGEAKAQLECRLVNDMHIGAEGGGNWLFVGEVVAFWVDNDLLDGTRVDQAKLAAVGRHAGNWYSTTEHLFEIVRPA
ncbi:MAG: flavin reductase family protein [Acidimicrobiales bacterium]